MQKVLRRTALAKSQAKRKARVHAEKKTSIENVQAKSVTAGIHREHLQAEREARQMRRDDWEMGPLAPWRDYAAAGSLKHGSWNARLMNPAPVPKEWRMKVCFFKVGDRVAVVEGKEGIKGRIGKLRSIERETETCIVEGVNRVSCTGLQSRSLHSLQSLYKLHEELTQRPHLARHSPPLRSPSSRPTSPHNN